jgi:hypothetical protein
MAGRSVAVVVALLFGTSQAAAQALDPAPGSVQPAAALALPLAGTTASGGTFTGRLTVHRFVSRNNQIVAVGTVYGTVVDPTGAAGGMLLTRSVETGVEVRPGQSSTLAPAGPSANQLGNDGQTPPAPIGLQAMCGVMQLEIAGLTWNILGLIITSTLPLFLDIGGEPGTPLGDIVCEAVANPSNIGQLVALLNQILLLLLGGLTAPGLPACPEPPATGGPGPAQPAPALALPLAGTTSAGGSFTGQLHVRHFASRNNHVAAEGMVAGVVLDAARAPVGTFLTGPVGIPVQVRPGGPRSAAPAGRLGSATPWDPGKPPATCGVLDLELGALMFDVLGVMITTAAPVWPAIAGETGSFHGDLVCQIVADRSDPVQLAALLNQLFPWLFRVGRF